MEGDKRSLPMTGDNWHWWVFIGGFNLMASCVQNIMKQEIMWFLLKDEILFSSLKLISSRTVDDHTMFSVHTQIQYKKSVWGVVKGFIEKNTWNGLEDFYTALVRALQTEYGIPPAKAKSRRARRGTNDNSIVLWIQYCKLT